MTVADMMTVELTYINVALQFLRKRTRFFMSSMLLYLLYLFHNPNMVESLRSSCVMYMKNAFFLKFPKEISIA